MEFSSLVFLFAYLPLTLLIYYIVPRKGRNIFLFFVNLLFYGWGEPMLVLLMVFNVAFNYAGGYLVDRYRDNPTNKKIFLILTCALDVGILAVFKYLGMIVETINLLPFPDITVPQISLPIGISFYTFQTMSYVIDVYRDDAPVSKNFINFGTYVALFPQLIAGPIVRYCDVAEQIRNRESTMADRLQGFYRFVIGLAKKVLIADVIGLCVDKMLGPAALDPSQVGDIMIRIAHLDTGTAWLVALSYTFQIYFDFAGYSDMAIGLGRIMGFKFPENFDNPYTSRSITEFWRRWHKTLGAFIMNYLYIPLGGNRKGKGRMYLNLWLCFLLSGLWHGASWNFVIWGALHGFFICLDKLFLGKVMKKIGTVPSVVLTFLTVTIIWVFFRLENLGLAWTFVTRMFAFDFSSFAFDGNAHVYTMMVIAALFSFLTLTGWGKRIEQKVYYTDFTDGQHIVIWIVAALLFIFCVAALNASSFSPFIYFRF